MPTETILIADDEPTIRAYIRNVLRVEGFNLLEASDGLDALLQVQQRGEPVDLLLTDIRMPRMDGISLARSVTRVYSRTPVLYISGYPFDLEAEQARDSSSPCAFLSKPFTRKALMDAVRKCLHPTDNVAGAGG